MASTQTHDSHEATEVSSRAGPDGLPPKVLPPRPASGRLVGPPPFVPPPELASRAVPPDLKAIVEHALEKDPDDRYLTAEAFAEDLERYLRGEPIKARRPGPLRRLRHALSRRRVLVPVALASLVLAVVAGTGATVVVLRVLADRERQQEEAARAERARVAIEAAWSHVTSGPDAGREVAYRRAHDALSAVLADAPYPRALLLRGVTRTYLLDLDGARADLVAADASDALALRPGEVARARALVELLAGNARTAFDAARAAVEAQALEADAPHAETVAHLTLAALALGPQEVAVAEAACGALATPTGALQAHAHHGLLALARGDATLAQARLEAAEDAGRTQRRYHTDVLLLRAALALERGQDAKDDYQRARESWPACAEPAVRYFNATGRERRQAGDLLGALRANQAAATLAPWSTEPWFYLGGLQLDALADAEQALATLRDSLRRDPFNSGARDLVVGLLLARPGRGPWLEEAAQVLAQDERLRTQSVDPPLYLAYARLRQGELRAATDALARAEALHRRRTALARAACYRLAGSEPQAATIETTYRTSNHEELEDRVEVARIYLEAGDVARALDQAQRAVQVDVGAQGGASAERLKGTALVIAARARAAQGNQDGALELLRQAVRHASLSPAACPLFLDAYPELAPLRNAAAWQELLAAIAARRDARAE